MKNKIWMKTVNLVLAAAMLLGNAPDTWALKEPKTKNAPTRTNIEKDLGVGGGRANICARPAKERISYDCS